MELSLHDKLKNLGYFFLTNGSDVFAIDPGGYERSPGLARLRKTTVAELKSQGLGDLIKMTDKDINSDTFRSLAGISSQQMIPVPGSYRSSANANSGDIENIKDLESIVQMKIDNYVQELKQSKPGDKLGDTLGNNISREDLQKLTGQNVIFSQASSDAAKASIEASAKAKDQQYAQSKLDALKAQGVDVNAQALSQTPGGGATNVIKQADGSYAVTDPSGKVLQSGFQNIAQALAVQNQITVGSTPQLSGRPDLFAVQPTQAEVQAGIQPIVPQAGMAPVNPMVAETKDIQALQAGTLPTPLAEQQAQQSAKTGTPNTPNTNTGTSNTGITSTGTTGTGTTTGSGTGTTTPTITEPPKPGTDFAGYADLPTTITGDPEWNLISDEMKKTIYYTYHAQQLKNNYSNQDLAQALKDAEAKADPVLKEALRIAQDTLTNSIASTTGDFDFKKKTLDERIKNIETDLQYNKGELGISEQADLAQQAQKYKSDLYNLQQSAAEGGLAFSSPRTTAESQLATQNQGLVTSTQRAYAQKQRQNLVESQRSMAENQQSIKDFQRQQQENLLAAQRAAEKSMGSSNLIGSVPGVTPLGGIVGTDVINKQRQVTNLVDVYKKNQTPFDKLFA